MDSNTPLLLLPYRLETRFVDAAEDFVSSGCRGPALLLRICPDQISIDSFDPRLTASESAAGAKLWSDYQFVQANDGDPKGPWSALVAAFGAPRAAYIAQACNPRSVPAAAPGSKSTSWEKPPIVQALPDYWIIECDDGSGTPLRVTTKAVTPQLAIGPDPQSKIDISDPVKMPLGVEMLWMVDFGAAVDCGMAACIPLNAEARAKGFQRIIAYGLQTGSDGTKTLTTLLRDHRFSDGLAFVPQGTPTKNTVDEKSGMSRSDPGDNTSYCLAFPKDNLPLSDDFEVAGPPAAPLTPTPALEAGGTYTAWTDARRAAYLLGIDHASNFGSVENADCRDQQDAIDIAVALWPCTMGYFVRTMMTGSMPYARRAAFEEWLRKVYIQFVRACGFLPALRVGSTPYGIAVATAWQEYKPLGKGDTQEEALVGFLRKAYKMWLQSQPAPNVMTNGTDPDAAYAETMAMDASSTSYSTRWVFGPSLFESIMLWQGFPLSTIEQWQQDRAAKVAAMCTANGIPETDPLVGFTSEFGPPIPWESPIVQDGVLSDILGLSSANNYISWLSTASISDIQSENYPGASRPNSLLYLLLRESILRTYVNLATDAQLTAGIIQEKDTVESELPDIAAGTKTPWAILDTVVTGVTGTAKFRDYLHSKALLATKNPDPRYPSLNELIVSLTNLAERPTAVLDRLTRETLDLFSYRLDAWINYIAHSLLVAQRNKLPSGIVLGGFSWVENVFPDATRKELGSKDEIAAVRALSAALTDAGVHTQKVFQPSFDNGGFIHAPSNAHAATAAILRSAFMSHKGSASGALLNIDLSSNRVRHALWLLEGVRQGQSLGALLGYRFEQNLIRNGFGADVLVFRNAYPLITGKLSPIQTTADAEGSPNVVDGTALVRAWQAGNLPSSLPVSRVEPYLRDLEDQLDALGDLGIAEGVFQIIRGNPEHAGAIMNAISQGDNPPVVQVANTPRGGTDFTHRVGLIFSYAPSTATPWSAAGGRAQADSWLNAWVSSQLPGAAAIKVRIVPSAPSSGPTPAPFTMSLSALNLSALDALALGDAADTPHLGELELRILNAVAANGSIPEGSPAPAIKYADDSFDGSDVTVPQFLVVVRAVRDLISHARALVPDDLSLPTGKGRGLDSGAIDLHDLSKRLNDCMGEAWTVEKRIQGCADGLRDDLINGAPNAQSSAKNLRASMLPAASFGIPACVPYWPDSGDLATQDNTLLARADIAAATIRSRLSGLPTAVTGVNASISSETALSIDFAVGGVQAPAKSWSPSAASTDLLTKLPKTIADRPRLASGIDTITLSGIPAGAWPAAVDSYQVTYAGNTKNAAKVVVDKAQGTVTLTVPMDIFPQATLTVVVSGLALDPGSYRIGVSTSSDTLMAQSQSTFPVGAGALFSNPSVTPVAGAGSAVDSWSISFSVGNDALISGATLAIAAPPGTQWSTGTSDYSVNGIAITQPPAIAGSVVQIVLPTALPAQANVTVIAKSLRNPSGGSCSLSISMGSRWTNSVIYTITPNADALQTAFETLFGRAFLVLPHFTPSNGSALANSVLSASQGATPEAIARWIQQLTYVRPAIDRFDRVTTIAQMLAAGEAPSTWTVLQQPYDSNDIWIGAASSPASVATSGRVTCLLQLPTSQSISFTNIAGLLVDEWVERIPSSAESTALAFHYQEPSARAPQALLLAVNPLGDDWEWNSSPPDKLAATNIIGTIIQSALDLAKIRAIDPLVLKDGAQFLPLTYIPTNYAGASTGISKSELIK